MKKLVVSLILSVSALFAQPNLYKGDINSQAAYEMQKKGVVIVDVRTPQEYNAAHAKDAVNIPVYTKMNPFVLNENFLKEVNTLLKNDKNKEVIVICKSGGRSKIAANMLANDGFKNVLNITKGFDFDWSQTTLPVEK